jgi:prefoldin subunit 5
MNHEDAIVLLNGRIERLQQNYRNLCKEHGNLQSIIFHFIEDFRIVHQIKKRIISLNSELQKMRHQFNRLSNQHDRIVQGEDPMIVFLTPEGLDDND